MQVGNAVPSINGKSNRGECFDFVSKFICITMIYVRNIFKQDLRKGKQIAFPKEPSISFFNFNYQKSDGESERQITFRLNSRELNSSFRSKDGHEITTRLYGANSESRIDGELKAFFTR